MTPEELVTDLEYCVTRGLHFEICNEDAQELLDYIRELECLANADKGVL